MPPYQVLGGQTLPSGCPVEALLALLAGYSQDLAHSLFLYPAHISGYHTLVKLFVESIQLSSFYLGEDKPQRRAKHVDENMTISTKYWSHGVVHKDETCSEGIRRNGSLMRALDYCLAGHLLWSAYQGYCFLLLQAFPFHLLLHKLLKNESALGEEECRN